MPLRWKIDHSEKFVHIVGEGPVTIEHMEEHFDAIKAQPVYTDDDVMRMGARLSAYTANLPSGPLAVVGQDDEVLITFRRFVNISPSKRPAKIFRTEAEALAWLKSLTNE